MKALKRAGAPGQALAVVFLTAAAAALLSGCGGKGREVGGRRSRASSPAERVLADLADRYASMKSFSERTRRTETVSGAAGEEKVEYRTEFAFRRPNLILYTMTGDRKVTIACDGERLVIHSPAQGGYVKGEPPEDLAAFVRDHHGEAIGTDEALLLAGNDPLEVLSDVTLEQGEPIGGQSMQMIKGTVRLPEQGSEEPVVATQSLWVGERDGLVHKTIIQITRGDVTLHIEEAMEELAADPELPDERFAYQPPAGAKDLTPAPTSRSPGG